MQAVNVKNQLIFIFLLWPGEKSISSIKIYFPNFPFLQQKVITALLPREQCRRMLIALFVSAVAVRIRKFTVTCFVYICIVADSQVSPSSKGGAKVNRVENGTLLVD